MNPEYTYSIQIKVLDATSISARGINSHRGNGGSEKCNCDRKDRQSRATGHFNNYTNPNRDPFRTESTMCGV